MYIYLKKENNYPLYECKKLLVIKMIKYNIKIANRFKPNNTVLLLLNRQMLKQFLFFYNIHNFETRS